MAGGRGNLFADLSRVVIEGSLRLGRRLEMPDEGSSIDLKYSTEDCMAKTGTSFKGLLLSAPTLTRYGVECDVEIQHTM